MVFNSKKAVLLSTIIVTVIISIIFLNPCMNTRKSYNRKLENFLNSTIFFEGDLIFRKGKSLPSQAVLITDSKSDYSHVGLIHLIDSRPYVIHAVPGESPDGVNYIKCEPISDFLSFSKVSKAALYRVNSDTLLSYAAIAGKRAKYFFDQKLLFDSHYDMGNDTSLYCTELVWKAYIYANCDLLNGKFNYLSIPLKKGKVIFPSSFLNSGLLHKVSFF